jgi:Spy/CpxP family protein refolding chaperone
MRTTRFAMMSILTLVLGAGVAAGVPYGRDAREPRGPLARSAGPRRLADGRTIAAYLHLSDDQRRQARSIRSARRDEIRPLIEKQRDLRTQLDTMLDDPQADAAALGRLVQQLHAGRQRLRAARDETRSKLAALLDADQKAKLDRLESVVDGLRDARRPR